MQRCQWPMPKGGICSSRARSQVEHPQGWYRRHVCGVHVRTALKHRWALVLISAGRASVE